VTAVAAANITPMQLRVLGSSGTSPVAVNPGSGYLVSAGDTHVLLDAGPGVAMALMAVLAPEHIDAIFLSHRHPDHCSDIFALFHHFAYGPRPPAAPLPVYAPGGLAEAAAGFVDAGPGDLWHDVFEWRPAVGVVSLGAVGLRFGEASHSVPAACVRAEAGGRAVVYSGDSGPGGDLAALAEGADLLLCEATYQDDTNDDYPFHLSARQAGTIAAAAGVSALLLTHLRPTLDPERSVAEASESFSGDIGVATPGTVIDL
jgi:ribonuclease BN (tRNA processing enzyme)